jgi:hypothetical protein
MSAATQHTPAPLFPPTATTGRAQYDQFSIKYYDQGSPLPSQITPQALSFNAACPYHTVVLGPRTLQLTQEALQSASLLQQDLLARMPPVGFTQEWRVGTSTSCGCTCAQSSTQSFNQFARDVDATVRGSSIVVSQRANTGRT